jgi:hypothetical protein
VHVFRPRVGKERSGCCSTPDNFQMTRPQLWMKSMGCSSPTLTVTVWSFCRLGMAKSLENLENSATTRASLMGPVASPCQQIVSQSLWPIVATAGSACSMAQAHP